MSLRLSLRARRTVLRLAATTWVAAAVSSACGSSGSSGDGDIRGGTGGRADAAPTTGGAFGTGGTGGAAGRSGAGGTAGLAGGTADADAPCPAPEDPTRAAVCLELIAEPMDIVPGEPDFDGSGVLVVQVFDTPDPALPDGGEVRALATEVLGADGGPVRIDDPLPAVRFEDLPSTVYVRALFFDAATSATFPTPGVWIGGVDLDRGLRDDARLLAVNLALGSGRSAPLPLTALRHLRVEVGVDSMTTPVDDGQGPAGFFALASPIVDGMATAFGVGAADCIDVGSGGTDFIEGVVVGEGPYFLFSELDDFGLGTPDTPPGALLTLESTGDGGIRVPAANEITIPARAYRHVARVDYTATTPVGDGSIPATFSCAPGDGGTADASDGSDGSVDAAADGGDGGDAGDATADATGQ